MGRIYISNKIAELLRNVHKLGVSDWNPSFGDYPSSHLTSQELRKEVAAHTAVLSTLFQESEPSKVPLEAYLWSMPVRRLLNQVGWIQGGVVVVDKFGATQVTRLDVDLPWRALRLPVIQPLAEISPKRMSAACFQQAWEEINRRVVLFPKVESDRRQRLLIEMGDWVYHHAGQPDLFPALARQELDGPMQFVAQKISGHLPASGAARRMYQALADHLAAAVMAAHFISLNRSRLKRRTSFLEFMNRERTDITRVARANAVLWVPDGEISFLLLEYLSTTLQPVHVGGRLIHQHHAGHFNFLRRYLRG